MTEQEENTLISDTLTKLGISHCPKCNRELGRKDISWANGQTEYGTPFCVLEIDCYDCDEEIVSMNDWYPEIDGVEIFCELLLEEYPQWHKEYKTAE